MLSKYVDNPDFTSFKASKNTNKILKNGVMLKSKLKENQWMLSIWTSIIRYNTDNFFYN